MKTMKIAILGFALTLAAAANAKKTQEQRVSEDENIPACTDVVKQCVAQGYEPGDHNKNGKGLWADCVGAVHHGKTVAGVTFTKEQAEGCQKAYRELHPKKSKK